MSRNRAWCCGNTSLVSESINPEPFSGWRLVAMDLQLCLTDSFVFFSWCCLPTSSTIYIVLSFIVIVFFFYFILFHTVCLLWENYVSSCSRTMSRVSALFLSSVWLGPWHLIFVFLKEMMLGFQCIFIARNILSLIFQCIFITKSILSLIFQCIFIARNILSLIFQCKLITTKNCLWFFIVYLLRET